MMSRGALQPVEETRPPGGGRPRAGKTRATNPSNSRSTPRGRRASGKRARIRWMSRGRWPRMPGMLQAHPLPTPSRFLVGTVPGSPGSPPPRAPSPGASGYRAFGFEGDDEEADAYVKTCGAAIPTPSASSIVAIMSSASARRRLRGGQIHRGLQVSREDRNGRAGRSGGSLPLEWSSSVQSSPLVGRVELRDHGR